MGTGKNTLLLIIVLALSYIVFGLLAFNIAITNNTVTSTIFVPEGISLAFAILFGKRVWPGILLGQTLLSYIMGTPLAPAFSIGILNSAEYYLAAFLFQRLVFDSTLKSPRDILLLFFVSAAMLQLPASVLGNGILYIFGLVQLEGVGQSIQYWWIGNFIAQAIITPLILVLYHAVKTDNNWKEALAVPLITSLLLYFTLDYIITHHLLHPIFTYVFIFMLTVLIVIRYELSGSVVMTGATAIILQYLAINGFSEYLSAYNAHNTLLYLNSFIIGTALPVNIIATSLREKKHLLHQLQEQKVALEAYKESLEKRVEEEIASRREHEAMLMHQARLASMGEMIGNIAHQWRQPLNAISVILSRMHLKQQTGKLDTEFFNDAYTNASQLIQKMSKTIDDFRNFFSPNNQRDSFNLADVIRDTLELYEAAFEDKTINISLQMDVEKNIVGFKNEFSQVLINMLGNAKDAFTERNIHDGLITIRTTCSDDSVTIEVEDNAGGIAEALLERIFEPYFTTKEEGKGTGIGLYMSKVIIEEHMSGTLSVKNTRDGACFSIVIPAGEAGQE